MVKKKHILFIVENNPVPQDFRVWNESCAAKEFGYDVTVICPKNKNFSMRYENIDGIAIYRHFNPLEGNGKLSFILEYMNATFWELLLSIWIYLKKPFHLIHAANPPDHIFVIALIMKLFGVKFIFDHHDITPENYVAKFNRKDIFYRILLVMENLTFKVADIVISTNESYKEIAISRGGKTAEQVFVVRNGPDYSNVIFMGPNEKLKRGFKYLVSYVGIIGCQEDIDVLLEAAEYIVYKRNISNIAFTIIGTGPHWKNMVQLSKKLKLEKYVTFTGFIPFKDLYEILASSDLCVNPEMKNEFTDKSTMIKIMEYMVFGKPIVQFNTTEGKVTAGDAAHYVKENSVKDFADAIIELLDDKNRRMEMGKIARKRVDEKLSWDLQKVNLKKCYESLGL